MIQVMIADDHKLIREGIKSLLEEVDDIEILGEVNSCSALEEALMDRLPDVLILDIHMEGRHSGLNFLEMHQDYIGKINILILSMSENISIVKRAIDLDATGYLPKSETSDCIISAIHTVASGALYLAPVISRQLLQTIDSHASAETKGLEKILTKREFTIFCLLGRGLTARKISHKLQVSSSTVSTHMENMKMKLEFSSTAELVRYALQWSVEEYSKAGIRTED